MRRKLSSHNTGQVLLKWQSRHRRYHHPANTMEAATPKRSGGTIFAASTEQNRRAAEDNRSQTSLLLKDHKLQKQLRLDGDKNMPVIVNNAALLLSLTKNVASKGPPKTIPNE
jgi:hypothetical protein